MWRSIVWSLKCEENLRTSRGEAQYAKHKVEMCKIPWWSSTRRPSAIIHSLITRHSSKLSNLFLGYLLTKNLCFFSSAMCLRTPFNGFCSLFSIFLSNQATRSSLWNYTTFLSSIGFPKAVHGMSIKWEVIAVQPADIYITRPCGLLWIYTLGYLRTF